MKKSRIFIVMFMFLIILTGCSKKDEECTHENVAWVIDSAATCLDDGIKHQECEKCKQIISIEKVEKLGHDIINHEMKEATCLESGYKAYDTCSRCSYTTYQTINALGHTESEWLIDLEATCTTNGTKHIECKACNTILKLEPIDKLGHDIINHEKVDATCLESGYKAYDTCSRCIYTTYNEIPALGHTELEWLTDVEATCTTNGTKHIECKICNTILKLEPITKLGHDIINHEKKEATCTVLGYEAYDSCSRCDYISSYKLIEALGHTESEWLTDVEATCTTNGTKHIECKVCNTILKLESITKLGHDIINHEKVDSTCLESGYDSYDSCSRCSYTTYQIINVLGHTESEWLTDVEATCTTNGTKHIECKACNTILKLEPITKLGHDIINHEKKEPTCLESGYDLYDTCSRCSYTTYQTINALGHDIISHEKKAPTCTVLGYEAYDSCSRCDYISSYVPIAALGHTELYIIDLEPTCTANGTAHIECKTCKEIIESRSIKKLGHLVLNESDSHISATCYSEGYFAYGVCERCERLLYNIIPKKEHDKIETIIWPTCSSDGYKAIACKNCNKIFEKTPLEPGFPYEGTTNEEKKQAMINDYLNDITEYLEGVDHSTFGTSEGKKAVVLSDLSPDGSLSWYLAATNSTSTFYGSTIYRAKWSWMVNYIMGVRESSGLSTTYFEDIIYRGFCGSPATLNAEIYNFFVNDHRTSWPASSNYKLQDDEGNPTLDNAYGFINNYKFHHISISVTEPTCLEEGLKIVKCDECDEIFNSNVLEKNGHTFSENECIYCKTKMSEVSNLVGNYIYFGEYPQSIKDENVTITSDTPDDNGYYLGSDGERYAKQKAVLKNRTDFVSISTVLIKNEFYYFKVEPIKWKILESDNGTYKLVTDLIIDIKEFNVSNEDRIIDGQTIYSNNYEYSDIRKWLNDEFYNKAFNEELQLKINTTLVDNSLASTGYTENPYICNDTYDKVYLLSKSDVCNELYGFINNEDRQKVVSDYTIAKGCSGVYVYYYQEEKFRWVASWWLRSPANQYRNQTMDVYMNGSYGSPFSSDYIGVVPSITITL